MKTVVSASMDSRMVTAIHHLIEEGSVDSFSAYVRAALREKFERDDMDW